MSADDSKTPFPDLDIPPRDDDYQTFHNDGEQVEIDGQFERGLRVGTWHWYYENGQKHWHVEYHDDGLKTGDEYGWHENGERMYEGQNVDHKKTGTWTWWHDNGEYKQAYDYDDEGEKHGEYVWDQADGSPRGRGEFWRGKRHGQWTWWDEPNHKKMTRGYHRGSKHGEEAAWYDEEQLAYRRYWRNGKRHGEEVEFYKDGSPKSEATWEHDHYTGERRTWDEDGNETVEVFVDHMPEELRNDAELMEKVAEQIANADEDWKKEDPIRDNIDYSYRTPFVIAMARDGHLDIASEPGLWSMYTKTPGLLGAEDVLELLRNTTPDLKAHTAMLPAWKDSIDQVVLAAYAEDPEPFREAMDELPEPYQMGLALVMARHGEDMYERLNGYLPTLAAHLVEQSVSTSMWWPSEVGIERVDLFDDQLPNDNFWRLLELFGSPREWGEAQAAAVDAATTDYAASVQLPRYRYAVEHATLEQLPALLRASSRSEHTSADVERAVFEWRDDSADDITEVALAIDDRGMNKWPAVACAILKHDEEGNDVPDALVDALDLDGGSPSLSWVDNVPRQIPDDDFKKKLSYINEQLPFAEPGYAFPRLELFFRALEALDEDDVRSVIQRKLDANYGKTSAAPYLHLVDDPEFWRESIEAITQDGNMSGHPVALGLAHLPVAALPLLEAAHDQLDSQEDKKTIKRAMIGVMAAAADRGEDWDEKWDEWINFHAVQKQYEYPYLRPLLMKLIHEMPRERAIVVLRREMERKSTFGRAFRFLASHPDPELTEWAFGQILEREADFSGDDTRGITEGIKHFPDAKKCVKWLLRNGGGTHIKRAFKDAVGHVTVDELEKELEEEGRETAKELDDIDKLVQLAEKAGGSGETIYVLRRLDERPEEAGYNQIGGLPPGIGAERWPTKDDEPMEHLYTMDVETMPELRSRVGDDVRAVSVFCASPGYNEAWEPGNAWSAVVYSTDEQLDEDVELPVEPPEMRQAWFEPVAIEVDPSIWADRESELRGKIYQASARVLGEPIWLQSEQHWGNLLMQFDEGFVHMNLGDMGVMYVFGDTAFWQCH